MTTSVLTFDSLTERQAEVVLAADFHYRDHRRFFGGASLVWFAPMMIGARDQSHHAKTLSQLVRKGWVFTKKLHAIYCYFDTELDDGTRCTRCCCKGSRKYRLTDAAHAALDQRRSRDAKKITKAPKAKSAVPQGVGARHRGSRGRSRVRRARRPERG